MQALEEENDAFEFGWKLIATDVFRPPQRSELLATLVGTGEQLLCMTIAILAISLLGFFSVSSQAWFWFRLSPPPFCRHGAGSNPVFFLLVHHSLRIVER